MEIETKMKTKLFTVAAALFLSSQIAFAAEQSVVEGKIVEVVPGKKEIYVLSEGKKHEYYFNEKTTVSKSGEPAKFADLSNGTMVKVTADKIGKRLDPVTVEIVQ